MPARKKSIHTTRKATTATLCSYSLCDWQDSLVREQEALIQELEKDLELKKKEHAKVKKDLHDEVIKVEVKHSDALSGKFSSKQEN